MSGIPSVGLLVFVRFADERVKAVLSVRGEYDFRRYKPEPWAGGCFATCYGTLQDGEEHWPALMRHAEQQLGTEAYLRLAMQDDHAQSLVRETDENPTRIFGLLLTDKRASDFMNCIRLLPSSGGFRPVTSETSIHDLTSFKSGESIPRSITAMLPADAAAVAEGFWKFK